MNKYKIIDISEQDFGCEERLQNEYLVDVTLKSLSDNNTITISVPDKMLYEKQIDCGSIVIYENNILSLF